MTARHRYPIDPGTADRLASGRLAADDAPPGYRRGAALLQTAGSGTGHLGSSAGADVAAVSNAVRELHGRTRTPSRRTRMPSTLIIAKALAALSAVTLSGSVAAAATGNLPTALQDRVANAVEHVGVNLPGGDHAVEAADHAGNSADAADSGQGADISDTARTTDATGVDKGAEISDQASDGKSRAGDEHGAPGSNPAGVDTPNGGGLDTAGTASDGANRAGAGHAADAAGDGSANAEDHPAAEDHPTADGHPTQEDHPGGRP